MARYNSNRVFGAIAEFLIRVLFCSAIASFAVSILFDAFRWPVVQIGSVAPAIRDGFDVKVMNCAEAIVGLDGFTLDCRRRQISRPLGFAWPRC